MKKTKLLALLSVLMIAAMLLVSCGGTPKVSTLSSFAKVLDKDYDHSQKLVASAKALTELDGYTVEDTSSEFILFAGVTADEAPVYKVFSFRSASIVATLTSSEKTAYEVELVESLPVFMVAKLADGKTTYTLYDATGELVATTKYDLDEPEALGDMIVYAGVIYTVDDDGKLTKFADLPENLIMSGDMSYSEDYFYFFDEEETSVQIFDRDFKFVAAWHAPSAAEDPGVFVLNGGDLLVQYSVMLDPETDEYDYHVMEDGVLVKLNLVTLRVAAKNGKAKEIDCDHKIYSVSSAYELKEWFDDGEYPYADSLKNLALVAPIVDKQIDETFMGRDLVTMSDAGKIQKSVKIVDGQTASLPTVVGDNLYLVSTYYGMALTNAKGKIVQVINNDSMDVVGNYIIGELGIYDLEMNKVYDLVDKKARVFDTMGETIFLIQGEDEELAYDIIAFRNGEEKVIASFDVEDENNKLFVPIDGINVYAILDTASGEYTYYNADGEKLLNTKTLLTVLYSAHGTAVLTASDAGAGEGEGEGEGEGAGANSAYYIFAE